MSPQGKTLAGLGGALVVAGALGLYAYYGVAKPGERDAEQKELDSQLFAAHRAGEHSRDGGALPPPKFTRLEITHGGTTNSLELKDGTWVMTRPLSTPADLSTVNAMLRTLEVARIKDLVEEKPSDADLARYGLAPPKFVLKAHAEVEDAAGKKSEKDFTLLGGIENTFDSSFYLRRDDDPRVYQADGSTRLILDKDTFALRDKAFLHFKPDQVTGIDFRSQNAPAKPGAKPTAKTQYVLARDAKTHGWRVEKPVALDADTTSIDQWLGLLGNEHALGYPEDGAEARKKLGFELGPQEEVTLTLSSGEPIRLSLVKQSQNGIDHAYALAQQGASSVLVEVTPGTLGHLDHGVEELRDKSVVTFPREQVAKVTVSQLDGSAVVIAREKPAADAGTEERWTLQGKDGGPAKTWKVSSLLWTLSSLKATGFGPEAPKDWAKFGLGPKARQVTLADADGRQLAQLWIGSEVPGRKGTVYVHGTRNQVLEVDAARLAELPRSVADLKDEPAPAADGGAPFVSGAPN